MDSRFPISMMMAPKARKVLGESLNPSSCLPSPCSPPFPPSSPSVLDVPLQERERGEWLSGRVSRRVLMMVWACWGHGLMDRTKGYESWIAQLCMLNVLEIYFGVPVRLSIWTRLWLVGSVVARLFGGNSWTIRHNTTMPNLITFDI